MRGRAQGVRPKEADGCRFSCPLRPAPHALGPGKVFFSRTPATIAAVLPRWRGLRVVFDTADGTASVRRLGR
jgi:hypothetical protein